MSTENQENQEVVETAENQEVVIPPHFAAFGVDSDEAFNEKVNYFKSIEEQWNGFQEKAKNVDETYNVLRAVEETPDEEIAALSAMKKQGMSLSTATSLLSASEETLMANPLKTLMLAEEVTDSKNFAKYKNDLEAALREEYGIGDGDYEPSAKMKVAAAKAVEKIMQFKNSIEVNKNPFIFAKERLTNEAKAFESAKSEAASTFERVLTGLNEVTDEQNGLKFNLKVTKEELDSILKERDQIASIFASMSPKEAAEKMSSYVKERILISKYRSGEVFKAWESSRAADVEQETVKRVLSGNEQPVQRGGAPKESPELSPIAREAQRLGLLKS